MSTTPVTAPEAALTTPAAAARLGIPRTALLRLIADGEINAHQVGDHYRVDPADIETYREGRLTRQREAFDELRDILDGVED